ncbi:MAG TPA: MBL fold metallo-hydrolase [Paenibacillaceae bacterium]|nr:MBL fold metallo-hydrolase [Paenibacillaceae bacterium]
MKFSVLASGSTGNAFYIESDETRLLVDAGLSGKQIEGLLEQIGKSARDLDGILITHEHSDHVRGVGVMARRYQLPVFANEKTWEELDKQIGNIMDDQRRFLEIGDVLQLDDLTIETFGTSHDAVQSMGFCFFEDECKVSFTTDLGYVSQKIKETIKGSEAYIFEANHDVEMLRTCSYPWGTKRRILSDVGHLSNESSGEALLDVVEGRGEWIYLAHLSKENNMTELARLTVKNILEEEGWKDGEEFKLMDTSPIQPTRIKEIKRK